MRERERGKGGLSPCTSPAPPQGARDAPSSCALYMLAHHSEVPHKCLQAIQSFIRCLGQVVGPAQLKGALVVERKGEARRTSEGLERKETRQVQ